jgi:hypothetical protein
MPRFYSATLSHAIAGKHRSCPVCLWVLEQDHEEALAMHNGTPPPEFDAEAIAAEVEADSFNEQLADNDLVFFVDPRKGPNDTLPYLPPRREA